MNTDYIKLALRNVRKRKLRSGLTVLGIIIAVATLFTLVSVSIGLQDAISEQFRALGTDKFFIFPKGQIAGPGSTMSHSLTLEDVSAVEKVTGVTAVSYLVIGNGQIEFGTQQRYVPTLGLPEDGSKVFQEVEAYKAEEGRLLKDSDRGVVMIGSQYKHNAVFKRALHVGDTIKVNGKEFRVKTILASLGNPSDDRLVYMPLEDFQELFKSGDRVDQMIVQVTDTKDMVAVAERVEKKLQAVRNVNDKTQDFEILTPQELLDSFGIVLNILTGFLVGVAAISLIVGGIGIANTMYTSVLERTREIGVMKAVGAKNNTVVTIFLTEAGFLGLVGGVLGVILGIAVGETIEYIAEMQLGTTLLQAATPTYLIIGCLLFALLAGALSGMLPALRAAKTNTVDALRYE